MIKYLSERTLWIIINDLNDQLCKDTDITDIKKNYILKELKTLVVKYEKVLVYKFKNKLKMIYTIKNKKYIVIAPEIKDKDDRRKPSKPRNNNSKISKKVRKQTK
jgi:hypothetical protein